MENRQAHSLGPSLSSPPPSHSIDLHLFTDIDIDIYIYTRRVKGTGRKRAQVLILSSRTPFSVPFFFAPLTFPLGPHSHNLVFLCVSVFALYCCGATRANTHSG